MSSPALESPASAQPLHEVQGTTTRTPRYWRNVVVAAAILAGAAGVPVAASLAGIDMGGPATALLVGTGLFAWLIFFASRGFTQSHARLFADRLEIGEPARRSRVTIPLADVRHVALHGATLEVFAGNTGDSHAITLPLAAAEDLFDQLTEHMERHLPHRFSIDDRGSLRTSQPWSFAELFPWQSTTDTARLVLEPDGRLEVRTAREEVFPGFRGFELELQGPGAAPMHTEPILRLDGDRLHTADGFVLARVAGGGRRVEFADGTSLDLSAGQVAYNGEAAGTIRTTPDGCSLELESAISEPVALAAVLVWTDAHHHAASAHGPDAPELPQPSAAATASPPATAPPERPALVIEPERDRPAAVSLFQLGTAIGRRLKRFLHGETSHAAAGHIAFYEDVVRVVRPPVRSLGERAPVEFALGYEEITRVEFVAPDTLVLGFGLVTARANRQIVLRLDPLLAQDKFDCVVDFLEGRSRDHLFSILDGDDLRTSRPWQTAERFPDAPLLREVIVAGPEVAGGLRWTLTTDAGAEYVATADHGLLLTAAAAPDRGLMQAFVSQVLDGSGFTLSRVERTRGAVGIRMARGEPLWWRADGDVLRGDEVIGHLPPDPGRAPVPDRLTSVMGTAMSVLPEVSGPRHLVLEHPLPEPWVLALVLVSLLPAPREGP